jgi:glycine/serine hydroxymethyltransferase
MKEDEMHIIADCIDTVLRHMSDENTLNDVKSRIKYLCKKFPIYMR